MLHCCVCADSNLSSTTVGHGHVESSLPLKFKLKIPKFGFSLLGSRAERDAAGTVTEEGQLKQICFTYRNANMHVLSN